MSKKTYVAVYNGNPMKGCWLRFCQIIRHLAEEGHRLYVVVPFPLEGVAHENIYPLLLGYKNSGYWGLRKIAWALRAAQLARTLAKQLENVEYLAFDTHNGLSFVGGQQYFQRKTLLVRGNTFFQAKYNEEPIYGLFMRAIDAKVRHRSNVVVYNHQQAYEHDRLQDTKKPSLIYLVENNSEVVPRCRLPNLNGKRRFAVGYCGQLSPRKNVQMLLKAMTFLPENEFELIVQGNWDAYPWSREAQKSCPANVQFLEWGKETASFYQRIDLFVLPSLYDDFSNAALDAIAYGVPVLLSNTGGSPYMVRMEPMLLFDLKVGVNALVEKICAIRDNYASACRKVGELSPSYCFDWASRMTGVLLDNTTQDNQDEHIVDRRLSHYPGRAALGIHANANHKPWKA